MSSPDKENKSLVDSLLKRGVSKQEIEKVHRDLRERGYGEEEARRRSQLALERLKASREMEERRRGRQREQDERRRALHHEPPAVLRVGAAPGTPAAVRADRAGRRAVDALPAVPQRLRRRINGWAFGRGLLITRLPERLADLASIFDSHRPDFVNKALLRLLATRRARRDAHPFEYSLIESLETLGAAARRLLGGSGERAGILEQEKMRPLEESVRRSLGLRDPFALEFFGRFAEPQEMLWRSLDYLGSAVRAGLRVEVSGLARVVKDGLRLVYCTQPIGIDILDGLFDAAREVNLAHASSAGPAAVERAARELAEAETSFRAAFQNMPRYGRELYPALLKFIAAFHDEMDDSEEKRARVFAFLELREEDILSYEDWQRRAREGREKELRERQERELARLEQEKAERFSQRFEGTLATLGQLFPESGIDRVEQGEFVLPYFINRVFTRSPILQGRITDLESLAAADPMGLVMVLHMILDDMLSSLDPWALEKGIGREGFAEELIAVRDAWQEAYPRLFDRYIDEIRHFARESDGDPRYVRIFRESAKARGIEERVNRLRNAAIRNFGHLVSERESPDTPQLHALAARLAELAAEAGSMASGAVASAEDPVRRRLADELASLTIIDFAARSQTGSTDYRPVTRQIRRWVEARHRDAVSAIPRAAQSAFLTILWGIAEVYSYLLNDPKSFAAQAGHGVVVAGDEERGLWARERGLRGRESLLHLEAKLKEEFPGQYVDALTGLRNKDFFLAELPRQMEKLAARRKPLTFLLIDIDHFKWVNDELGHSKGDEVLKLTAAGVLDGIREGDLAVRYGGEEMLVVVPAELHTGVVLAERLRSAQEQVLAAREALAPVRDITLSRGQPCGTLSIGVADAAGLTDPAVAVDLADKALYAAKRARNRVVLVDPEKSGKGGEPFTSYAEYLKGHQSQ